MVKKNQFNDFESTNYDFEEIENAFSSLNEYEEIESGTQLSLFDINEENKEED